MATTIASPEGRELHLIDVENLLGTPYFTTTAVSALRSTYDRVSGTAPAAQQVIGTSACSNLLTAALAWSGARPVFEKGTDGADHALLAAGEYVPEARFGRVVIGSGDHAFAPYAAELQRHGVDVTVVCLPESLSIALRLAVRDVRYLPHIHSAPTTPTVRRGFGRVA